MRSHKPSALALALSGLILLGAVTLTAVPSSGQKKKPAKPAPASKLIAEGKKVYEKNGCATCHVIKGQGGKTGPDLTTVGKEHKADWLTKQIRDPKQFKADSLMPAYGADIISDKDLKALVAYLVSLKK